MKKIQLFGTLMVLPFVLLACVPSGPVNTKVNDVPQDQVMKKDEGLTDGENGVMIEKDVVTNDETMVKFTGNILAGKSSPVIGFNQADYEIAKKSGKIILLYFYANWCPECIAEVPRMYDAFNTFTNSNIVAFRVNYNDNETDNAEKALAKEFGVAYQHTKVILQEGIRVLKSPEAWEMDRYIQEINKVIK